jgi:hypothetical protein
MSALTGRRLRTPRAAAVAGIMFGLLLGTAYVLIRIAIPADLEDAAWLEENSGIVTLALSLVPFAGIAFLWFVGVVRDRLGRLEDQFFSTVFFGSGLLFLAMVFVSAAGAAGLLTSFVRSPDQVLDSGVYSFGRELIFRVSNVYAIRMAGVFMISLATIGLRTRAMPMWLDFLTYVLALVLLFVINFSLWVSLIFPAWVLVVSVYFLVVSLRENGELDLSVVDPA